MTELGESAAAPEPVVEKEEKGDLEVAVHDVCDGGRIEDVKVTVNGSEQITNGSGVTTFSDLSIGATNVKVILHLEDLDYSTFVVHYPKILRSHSAKSKETDVGEVEAGSKNTLRVELEIFKIVGKIVFHRRHIDPGGDDKYGHWWTVVDENTSFGWWPKYPVGSPENRLTEPPSPPESMPSDATRVQKIQHMFSTAVYGVKDKMYSIKESGPGQTLRGVEGELNAKYFGGIVDKAKNIYGDPHALGGDSGDEQYQPVRNDCFTLSEVKDCTVNFALSYGGGWSWRLEAGNHCHTFQKKIMKQCKLEKNVVLK